MQEGEEAKELKLDMLKKHDGYLYIVDPEWMLSKGIIFHETEDSISFMDWCENAKASYENMMIHTYFKAGYGKLWMCYDSKPTLQQRVKTGRRTLEYEHRLKKTL